jgi:hypothetical protein
MNRQNIFRIKLSPYSRGKLSYGEGKVLTSYGKLRIFRDIMIRGSVLTGM